MDLCGVYKYDVCVDLCAVYKYDVCVDLCGVYKYDVCVDLCGSTKRTNPCTVHKQFMDKPEIRIQVDSL